MRPRRFTEEQIRYAVQQAEAGVGVAELCRKSGVAEGSAPYRSRARDTTPVRMRMKALALLRPWYGDRGLHGLQRHRLVAYVQAMYPAPARS